MKKKEPTSSKINKDDNTEPVARRCRSNIQGVPVQSSDKCILCGKPEDKKHPNRPYSKLLRIEQKKRLESFQVMHTNMRERILTFI